MRDYGRGVAGRCRMNDLRFELESNDQDLNHKTSDDYYTPLFIFEALGVKFDLDVSGPPGGVPWIPAQRTFSILDDGLFQDWEGQKVWMNPPFSKPTPWIEKFIKNNNGIALLPFSKGGWFITIWEAAGGLLPLDNTLKFHRVDGAEEGIFMPVFLAAMGDVNVEALRNSGLGHVR